RGLARRRRRGARPDRRVGRAAGHGGRTGRVLSTRGKSWVAGGVVSPAMHDDGLDRDLVTRIRRGSSAAVGALFDRHWRPAGSAWRIAVAITGSETLAEDVVQDAFLRALGALDRYDPARPFAPWLRRIVVNRALDVWREERRRAPLDPDALPGAEAFDEAQRE